VLNLSLLLSEYSSSCWRSIPGANEEMGRVLDPICAAVALVIELGKPKVCIDERLTLKLRGKPLLFGKGDNTLVYPDAKMISVLDLKYGKKHVKSDSGQLKIYALAAADTLIDWQPERYSTTILQPRDGGRAIRTATHSAEEMAKFRDEVYRAIEATENLNPVIVPGSHCSFCKACSLCDARKAQSIENDFADL
jgi:hypothetical protein